jgi:phenylalanyl-tRNA synthetase beta chain
MQYSYNWLKELSGTKKTPEQVKELLMTHAFEVESVEKFSHGLDGVIVGKVVTLVAHPNADKLRVAGVEVAKDDVRQIVCGAPNIAVGQKVAVALPEVILPGNFEIRIATIRGIESRGMVCSAKELGLGDDHTGILVLPDDTPVGVSFVKHFGLEDSILEVKILPDRGADALAYEGMAREIAALDGHTPHFVEEKHKLLKVPFLNHAPKISIEDKNGCPRYIGVSFENITVGESPLWLKIRLILSGLRPISNIVDITNYLMLLTGQPTHAFDTDKLSGSIHIRRAKEGETLTLLTGETKTLKGEDLVIADDKQALALAGVMGGLASAVTRETKNIFLEIANFDGASVRRTKSRHTLPTDASYRFERGLDPNLAGDTLALAEELTGTLTGGKIVGMRDIYPQTVKAWTIALSLETIEDVLGAKLTASEVKRSLTLLGMTVEKSTKKNTVHILVPTRRPDLRDQWDLIEEVGRMRGYDKVTPVAPLLPLVSPEKNKEKIFEREVKQYLAHAGFDEIMTYSFYGEKEIAGALLPLSAHLELISPLSPDQKYLRMSQIPLMLRKVRENLRYFDTMDCFEWGSDFAKKEEMGVSTEMKSFGLITVLAKKSGQGEAFYAMKGKVHAFLEALHIDQSTITFELPEKFSEIPQVAMLHPTRSACVVADAKLIGIIGELRPSVLQSFDLESRLAVAEFFASELAEFQKKETLFVPLQKFPYAVRDISLTFPRKVTVSEVERLLREAGAPLLKHCELFDVYEQGDEKNLAFHLSFGADDRTLESAEMDATFDRIVALGKERFGARLRL